MLSKEELYKLAKCRFEEAEILLASHKPDGAVYLSGYAIELMLKRKITDLLDWDGYPANPKEFESKLSFKIHKLPTLLHFSGLERRLKSDTVLFARWQIASTWDSEIRYQEIGVRTEAEAQDIIEATRDILNFILAET
jgi:hypothetical protein